MFKKGEYIVINDLILNDVWYPGGYCYKQREDSIFLSTEIDCKGVLDNINYAISFNNKNQDGYFSGTMRMWRYATADEIMTYMDLQRPFSVNDIILTQTHLEKMFNNLDKLADKIK